MEGLIVWRVAALVLALAAGVLAGSTAYRAVQRRVRAAAALTRDEQEAFGLLKTLAQTGFAPLAPLARKLLAFSSVEEAVSCLSLLLEERGVSTRNEAVLTLLMACAACVTLVAGVLAQSVAGGVAAGCCVVISACGYARTWWDKRCLAMREEVPEALRSMGVCFRSGLSLLQTLQQTAHETKGPLKTLFTSAAHRLELGCLPSEALAVLRSNRHVPELAFVAVALDVQHQSGGSISPVLDAARESVEGELELLRSLRVQTAQAKLSARIVTLMPFALVALFSLMSGNFLAPFFESAAGVALLALALGMQLAGVLVVRRILQVEAR